MTGRTLNEMLMTLAIIGVLSIAALMGLNYAMAKANANLILNDVNLAYAEASMTETMPHNEPTDLKFTPESGYGMQIMRLTDESAANGYMDIVIVKDIPKRVCEALKKMKGQNGLSVFELDTTDNVYQGFTTCNDLNEMVFTFGEIMGICDLECPPSSRCVDGECHCNWGYEVVDNECKAIECDESLMVLDHTKEYCCIEFGNGRWLDGKCDCPEGFYMRDNECLVAPEGFCIVRTQEPNEEEIGYTANCAYTLENPTPSGYTADCSLTITEPSEAGYTASCSYTVTEVSQTITIDGVTEETIELVLSSSAPCDDGTYCVLKWGDETCSSGLSGTTMELYGRCVDTATTTDVCNGDPSKDKITTSTTSCTNGTYCVLKWGDASCSSGISGTITEIHGKCVDTATTTDVCNGALDDTITMTPDPILKCGSDQYCVLKWKDEECSSGVLETATNVFGKCVDTGTTTDVCSGDINDTINVSFAIGCDEKDTYCHVRWNDENCTGIQAESRYVFGACVGTDETTAECPKTEREE